MASGEKPLPENSSPDESIGGRGSAEFKNRSFFGMCHAPPLFDIQKLAESSRPAPKTSVALHGGLICLDFEICWRSVRVSLESRALIGGAMLK
jgi:hypothetical protein